MVSGVLLVSCVLALCIGTGTNYLRLRDRRPQRNATSSHQIPLELLLRFSRAEDVDDFIQFVDQDSLDSGLIDLGLPIRGAADPDGAPVVPPNAVCKPEEQVVSLVKNKDPAMLYFPLCTRLPQCGGCCASELLSCQPTKMEIVNFTVYVTQYGGGNTVSVKQKRQVSVEKHLQCKCSCAVKREHCNQLQTYEQDKCRCKCFNTEDEERCQADNDTKIWDSNKCVCSCRQIQNCSTGYFYDLNACACSELEEYRRNRAGVSISSRSSFGARQPSQPLPVIPLRSVRRERLASP